MDNSQAKAVIAALQAYFPRFPIPESTQDVWAPELEPFDFETGMFAVRALSHTWPDEHYPGLQAILGKIREVTGATASPALPFPEVDPAEAARSQTRMHQIVAGFFEGREDERTEAEIRLGIADAATVDQHSRAKAARLLEESASAKTLALPALSGGRLPACSGVGQPWEIDEKAGVKRCPCRDANGKNCGVEMPLDAEWPLDPEAEAARSRPRRKRRSRAGAASRG